MTILEENSTPMVCDDSTLPTSAAVVISELAIQLEKKQGLFEVKRWKETQSGIRNRTFIFYKSVQYTGSMGDAENIRER